MYGYIKVYTIAEKSKLRMMSLVSQNKDEQKRLIGEYLKTADRFIKSADFPRALEQVNKALALEPNNMYALAYNERIKVATEAAQKKEAEDQMKKTTEERKPAPPPLQHGAPGAKPLPQAGFQPVSAPPPPRAVSPQVPADDMLAKIKKEAQDIAEKKAQERIETLTKEFSAAQQKYQTDIVELKAKLDAAIAAHEIKGKENAVPKQESGATDRQTAGTLQINVDRLKILFVKAWEDGAVSAEERALLETLKSALDISDSAFIELENEAKNLLYRNALRKVWHDGVVTPEEADELAQLREKFNVSAEDHFKYEAELRKGTQKK
jgi:hypothetical protein